MNELLCKLSEFESIKIVTKSGNAFNKIDYCCSEVQAYFASEQQLRIGQGSAGEFFEHFIKRLKKAIGEKLQLHELLTQNLGFMQNQYYQDKTGFIRVPTSDGSSTYWVGFDYEIWEAFNDAKPPVSTWLYNDFEGNIILEVAKNYPWHFIILEGEPEDPDFITYDEFMKNYKPIIHRVIPRDVAIECLDQAMKAYRELFSSEEKYQNMCKENNW